MFIDEFVAFGGFQIFPDHFGHQFVEADLRRPAELFRSSASNLATSSLWVESISRSWTKVRTTIRLTSTARSDRKTLPSIKAPCSVKA
jgi:hypothetical protein